MKFNRKLVVVIVLGIMLAITGYLNYTGESIKFADNNSEDEYIPIGEATPVSSANVSESNDDYFKKTKIDREAERAESIELLNDIVNNSNSTHEAKTNAENKLASIADNIEIEAITEGLIKAKGYRDALVYISDSSVNVVVGGGELTAADTAKIRDIVFEQTKNNNIKIVAVE